MLGKLGVWEIMAIITVIALVFGSRKLPAIGRSIGETIKNFKKSLKDDDSKA